MLATWVKLLYIKITTTIQLNEQKMLELYYFDPWKKSKDSKTTTQYYVLASLSYFNPRCKNTI